MPLSEAQSTTAGAPLPPPGLDPRAHIPMRAREGYASDERKGFGGGLFTKIPEVLARKIAK